ncbi:hypothetical protein LXL04_035557 [Taraxacum kok-saghyz]
MFKKLEGNYCEILKNQNVPTCFYKVTRCDLQSLSSHFHVMISDYPQEMSYLLSLHLYITRLTSILHIQNTN